MLKNKKNKNFEKGLGALLAAYQGGYSVTQYATIILHAQICNSEVLFTRFIAFNVYFIILDIKRAENA